MSSKEATAATLTLDWDQVANDPGWSSGSLAGGSFGVGGGFVDVSFEQGSGVSFVGFGNGVRTPDINSVLNGTDPDSDRSLHLQINAEQVGLGAGDYAVTMNTQFSGYSQPITDVSFWLYDIDIQGNSWQDRIILRGFQGSNIVSPSFNFLYPGTNTVEVIDAFTLDGVRSVGNDDDQSNVLVAFNDPIDRFELIFTDGDDIGTINPASHGIGIGDISFTETEDLKSVPEPASLLGLMAVGLMAMMGYRNHLKP
ncbi:MAG: PEP-CTERM sorting domain-containing protein [Cyanothece sp. SIO2G6]|nr:PEP-CTERM sorting domain-containing protein [Cyanothece sp. SIO2G6]